VTEGRRLAVHVWGEPGAPRALCLHGVTGWGGHFGQLAERRLADSHHVLAPDLLGHGASPAEPPWDADAQLAAILETVGRAPALLVGHSYGARLALELAAREPSLVERLVLLDPAIKLEPAVALFAAENARRTREYATFAEAVERRYEESQLHRAPRELVELELREQLVERDGRWRYPYAQAAVVATYGTLATDPPPYEAVCLPTLLVLGEESYVPYDHLLDAHTAALGDLLEVVRVPGGHTVLWDALDETTAAIVSFLGSPAAPG
jgi:lipase